MEPVLLKGDCLRELEKIPDYSVAFSFACLPKSTASPINANRLFTCLDRVMKPTGTAVMLVPNIFVSSEMVLASLDHFFKARFDLIWRKPQGTNPLMVHLRPLKNHESLLVFQSRPKKATYNPQMGSGASYAGHVTQKGSTIGGQYDNRISKHRDNPEGSRYPTTCRDFPQARKNRALHADGQPGSLAAYLIQTYSNPTDVVLDYCMGAGTAGVEALKLNRRFVGIEIDEKYFQIAKNRLTSA